MGINENTLEVIVVEIEVAQTEERGKTTGSDAVQMIMAEVDGVQLVQLGEGLFGYDFQLVVADVEDGQPRHVRHWNLRHIGQKIELEPELVGVGRSVESAARNGCDLIVR